LPPVGALDQPRAANGEDGIVGRVRSNPRLVVAIAAGAILLLAWIGWAIYVTSSNGASAGLGVVIAWPAMLAALALISLPFIGGYLLIRRLSDGEGSTATAEVEDEDKEPAEEENGDDSDEGEENPAEEEGEDEEDSDDDDSEEEDEDDEGDDSEEVSDDDSETEATAEKS
jgi:hypothetical protein